jgi:hypothetical protein
MSMSWGHVIGAVVLVLAAFWLGAKYPNTLGFVPGGIFPGGG